MGQFLIIGLKLEACVYKDRVNKYVNERRTEAEILSELEETKAFLRPALYWNKPRK